MAFLRKQGFCAVVTLILLVGHCQAFFSNSFGPNHVSSNGIDSVKKAPRWNIPWLGIGIRCNGCPHSSCEDDEAIIHGYCCGCAAPMDKLPVVCPSFLQCPLNLHGLCHDYEYMMRCCC